MKKSPIRRLSSEEMKRIVGGHMQDPCNGDPFTGRNYAQHHIVPLSGQGGALGQGHKPGTHKGFSICV